MAKFQVISSDKGLTIKSKAGKKALKKAYAKLADAGIEKVQAIQLLANLIPVNLDDYDQDTTVEDGAVVITYGDLDKDDLEDAIKDARKEILEALTPDEEEDDESDDDDNEEEETFFDDEDENDDDDSDDFDDDDDNEGR